MSCVPLGTSVRIGWYFQARSTQPVLNHLTGRPSYYGVKDYDLAYFDGADLS
jgi:hypothetical protein